MTSYKVKLLVKLMRLMNWLALCVNTLALFYGIGLRAALLSM